VQTFVARKIVEQNVIAEADAGRGRFRSFLFRAFHNFVCSELRRETAARRRPHGGVPVSLDDMPDGVPDPGTPAAGFDEEWGRQTLHETLSRMRDECLHKEQEDVWRVFSYRILGPILDGVPTPSYEQLVERFEFGSPTQASNKLITAKRMFRRLLVGVVRDTVGSDADVELELRELCAVFSGAHAESASGMRNRR